MDMKGIDEIVQNAIAGVQQFAAGLAADADRAKTAASAIVEKARAQVEILKEYADDVRTGRLFQADKMLVEEVDFDEAVSHTGGGAAGQPIRHIELRIPEISFLQELYRGGDENFRFQGRYRVLVVFQKMAPKKKE